MSDFFNLNWMTLFGQAKPQVGCDKGQWYVMDSWGNEFKCSKSLAMTYKNR